MLFQVSKPFEADLTNSQALNCGSYRLVRNFSLELVFESSKLFSYFFFPFERLPLVKASPALRSQFLIIARLAPNCQADKFSRPIFLLSWCTLRFFYVRED